MMRRAFLWLLLVAGAGAALYASALLLFSDDKAKPKKPGEKDETIDVEHEVLSDDDERHGKAAKPPGT